VKLRKQQLLEKVTSGFTAKTRLINVGNGNMELGGNAIKFYVVKGRFKKQKKIAKEIPFAEIETFERVDNELNIVWQGFTDRFVLETTELAETIHAKITEALDAQRKTLEAKEEALKQERNELVQALSDALKITDSLFDVLRSLHGRVNWNRVERHLKCSKDYFRRFADKKGTVNLDSEKLSSAMGEHLAAELSKEVYSSLRALFEYFNGLASQNGFPERIHPNHDDAKKVILAYYTLNDIILGMVVGAEDVGKESIELMAALDDLSKGKGLTIDVVAVKDVVNKLVAEKEKESVVEECRSVFMQQLNALLTA